MAPSGTVAGHFHAVRFYDSAESLCRIVGMVDVLWKKGQSVAAVKLEMLWNNDDGQLQSGAILN